MVKKIYKIYKNNNDYLALMTAYGLVKIIKDNDFSFILRKKKAFFEIEADVKLPYEDWIFESVTEELLQYVAEKISNQTERRTKIKKLHDFLSDPKNMSSVFHYYETGDSTYLKGIGKDSIILLNSIFFTKGRRGGDGSTSLQMTNEVAVISMYGYLSSISFYATKSHETISVFYPKEATYLRRPFEFMSKEDKETGERKRIKYFGKDQALVRNAILYLEAVKSLQRKSIIKQFESIFVANFLRTTQKPTPDKSYHIPIHSLSIDCCDELLKLLTWSKIHDEIKYLTAQLIVFQAPDSFGRFVRHSAKRGQLLLEQVIEELIGLQTERMQEIYSHPVVKTVGKRLSNLLYRENRGHQAKVALIGCKDAHDLSNAITLLSLDYEKKMKGCLLSIEEVEQLMAISKDDKDVRMVADAILTYSVSYKTNKEKDSNSDKTEKQEENPDSVLLIGGNQSESQTGGMI